MSEECWHAHKLFILRSIIFHYRLSVVGEAFLEFFASEEDAALYGAEGEVHLLGNLVVLVTGNVH